MSDKLASGIKAGSVNVSLPIELRKAADSTSLTGIVFGGVTASYWRQGGVRVAITPITLGSVNAAFASGGFIEVDATNMAGLYRFDVPDAAFAAGADWVVISLKVATAFQLNFMFALESVGAAEVYARIGANGAGLTVLSTQASVDDLPTNAELATALAAADDAMLAQIAMVAAYVDTEVAAIKAKTDNLPAAPAAVGDVPSVASILAGITADHGVGSYVAINPTAAVLAGITADHGAGSYQAVDPTAAVLAGITAEHGAGSYVDSGGGGGGGGANIVTVTVTDGVNPLQNANVRMTEGVNTFSVVTDENGVALFGLDAATYNLSITKDGYQFTPVQKVVDGEENFVAVMTPMEQLAPPPGLEV